MTEYVTGTISIFLASLLILLFMKQATENEKRWLPNLLLDGLILLGKLPLLGRISRIDGVGSSGRQVKLDG